MPDPITSSPSRPIETNPLPIEAPTVAPTPDAWQQYLDSAVESVQQTQSADPNQVPSRPALDAMMRDLYAAFRQDGGPGVHTLLRSRPELLSTAARLSEDGLRTALRDANGLDGFLDGLLDRPGTVADLVRDHIEGAVRSRMLEQGRGAAQQVVGRLDALAESLPESLDRLQHAEPGTADAQIATLLDIRGDDGDLERAQAKLAHLRDSVEDFASRMAGFTWEPGDFPQSADRALRTLGLGDRTGSSLADDVANEGTSDDVEHAIDHANLLGELAFDSHHIHDAVVGLARGLTAGSAGYAVAIAAPIVLGVVVEHVLAHQIELNRAQFQATGQMLGM
jgi:hypothetical protein